MELKKISISVMINDNEEGAAALMPAEEVDALVALYNNALATVLVGIDEEDHYQTFDAWLKVQNSALYDKAMKAFIEEYSTRMSSEPLEDEVSQYVSLGRDKDGVYLESNNRIQLARFSYA